MTGEDDSFGWAVRRQFLEKDAIIADLQRQLRDALTEGHAARRERDAAHRQLHAVADRADELRDELVRLTKERGYGHFEGRADGHPDARGTR